MRQIETKHNGRTIIYAENEDVWRCWALDLEAKTLSALKTKMNKLDADARRLMPVPVILLSQYGMPPAKDGAADLIADEKSAFVRSTEKKHFSGNRTREEETRRKVNFGDMAPDTDEARAEIARWIDLEKKANFARRIASEAFVAIPRVTLEKKANFARRIASEAFAAIPRVTIDYLKANGAATQEGSDQ